MLMLQSTTVYCRKKSQFFISCSIHAINCLVIACHSTAWKSIIRFCANIFCYRILTAHILCLISPNCSETLVPSFLFALLYHHLYKVSTSSITSILRTSIKQRFSIFMCFCKLIHTAFLP